MPIPVLLTQDLFPEQHWPCVSEIVTHACVDIPPGVLMQEFHGTLLSVGSGN